MADMPKPQPADMAKTLEANPGLAWSVLIRDVWSGTPVISHNSELSLKTASVGKLFLLTELADAIANGRIDPGEMLNRNSVDPVRDSGLWYQLASDTLPVADVATLVGAVSDNWATNVLLARVGLASVQARALSLGYKQTQLHDSVRDLRDASHPATLSTGCAAELSDFFMRLAGDRLISAPVCALLRRWLSASVDLTMAASALALDPLINGAEHHPVRFLNKTGSDTGVRADVGLVEGTTSYAYAVIVNWNEEEVSVHKVLKVMRQLGQLMTDD